MTPKSIEEGRRLLEEGNRAPRTGGLHALVQADAFFHAYIYELSCNPLFLEVMGRSGTRNGCRRSARPVYCIGAFPVRRRSAASRVL
jgi:DNA-binding GntR family transcriptional regulator